MNQLDTLTTFIQTHISAVNKNNTINIHIGKIISDQIFINKHTSTYIQTLLHTLENVPNVTIDTPQYIQSYCVNNTVFKIYSNKFVNYSYTTEYTTQLTYNNIDCKLTFMHMNTKPNVDSHYKYNLIEEQEEIIIHYKHYFDITIVKYVNSSYGINIIIYKPIDQTKLLPAITSVLQLL